MPQFRTRAVAAVIGALAFAGSATPAAAQSVEVPPGRWVADIGLARCSLARREGGPGSTILILTYYLGRDEPELILLGSAADPLPRNLGDRVRVQLGPGAPFEEASMRRLTLGAGPALMVRGLPADFVDRFARARMITLEAESGQLLQMVTPFADRGVAALRDCNDNLVRSWGIDLAAQSRLQRPARILNLPITATDYPRNALRAGEQGEAVARLDVDIEGRTTHCTIVASARSEALDGRTCELLMRRARFEPALDASGAATPAQAIYTVLWRIRPW